jgi:hypothetical protein
MTGLSGQSENRFWFVGDGNTVNSASEPAGNYNVGGLRHCFVLEVVSEFPEISKLLRVCRP